MWYPIIKSISILLLIIAESNAEPPPVCEYFSLNCPFLVNGSIVKYPNYKDYRTMDLIRLFGYYAEEHKVTTEDDYILTLQRIIPFTSVGKRSKGIPVFCMHGLLASSAQWFWQPRQRALIFMLADAGYDVWLGNARGTSYSQDHVHLTISNLEYWNFSSFELGKYDIPAVINHILTATSQPSLYYIGHSLGAQQFFVAVTLHPELNSKIRTMFALSPAVYTGNTTNPLLRASVPVAAPYYAYQAFNIISQGRHIQPALAAVLGDLAPFCAITAFECSLCHIFYFGAFGFDACQCDYTTLPGLLTHMPDTASSKTYSHSTQAIASGEFRQYDYGTFINLSKYGTSMPPHYNWSLVDVPVVLFWGENDNLVVPKDIEKTAKALGTNLKENIRILIPGWNHLDFVAAKDADIHVYNPIIEMLNTRKYG